MSILRMIPRRIPALALAAVVALACEDDPSGVSGGDELDASALHNKTLSQVDRMGFAALNTAFVSASADKNAFNAGTPSTDEANFTSTFVQTIMARYGLTQAQAEGLTDLVLPDALPLGDLSGYPNGRRLQDDVIDISLGLIFGVFGPPVAGLQSDGVDANDAAFLNEFPYLGTPNS